MTFAPHTRASRGRLARAIRGHTEKHLAQGARDTHYGIVRAVNPLQVELEGHALLLTEDDVLVSQWVRRYDYDYGLVVGDTVLVTHLPNDDFVVHDVISTDKIETGFDLAHITASSDPTGANHVIKKVPMLADDGSITGYTPIYGSLP